MAETVELWFNPRCSKARQARALLDARGVELRVIAYLDAAPSRADLETLLRKLGTDDPLAIVRTKESVWSELGLDGSDRGAVLDAIVAHPILLERPIVVRGERAVVARPPERLEQLFG